MGAEPLEVSPKLLRAWRRDFPRFCKDCLYIVNKDAQLVPFELNIFQRFLWEKVILADINAGRPTRLYLLKARQLGSSTFFAALQHWRTVLWAHANGLVVAHDLDTAAALFTKQKVFYGKLPGVVKPARKLSNRKELDFSKDDPAGDDLGLQSRLQIQTAKDIHIGAGMTLHTAHLSEFARYESVQQNVKLSLATLLQTVPSRVNTFVCLETTAWGMGFAYDLWVKDNLWTKLFVSWLADPTYTEEEPLEIGELHTARETTYGDERLLLDTVKKELVFWHEEIYSDPISAGILEYEALCRLRWRRQKIDLDFFGSKELFAQEYPSTAEEAFLTSGTSVFDTRKLADYKAALDSLNLPATYQRYNQEERDFLPATYGDLRVYENPIPRHRYVIGADVSEGLSDADKSAAHVLDVDTMKQVAVYQGTLDPAAFADALAVLGRRYNTAHIGVEVNGPGFATNLRLSTGDHQWPPYPFIYQRQSMDTKTRRWMKRYGWHTNRATKTVMITDLRRAVRDDLLIFTDKDTLDEMGWYIKLDNSEKMGAAHGYNDDLVMSLALALQLYVAGNFGALKPRDEETKIQEGSFLWFSKLADNIEMHKDTIGWN